MASKGCVNTGFFIYLNKGQYFKVKIKILKLGSINEELMML